jgi:hypothetical protein
LNLDGVTVLHALAPGVSHVDDEPEAHFSPQPGARCHGFGIIEKHGYLGETLRLSDHRGWKQCSKLSTAMATSERSGSGTTERDRVTQVQGLRGEVKPLRSALEWYSYLSARVWCYKVVA